MSERSIPEKYKVAHLLLLVGGNPLPNAVAGRLLVQDGGRITLVHSAETKDIADSLATWFKKKVTHDVDDIPVKESDADNIYAQVQEVINSSVKTGLNYTGGTKAMAVHAHRAYCDLVKEEKGTPITSYLDSRDLQIVSDDGHRYDAVGNLSSPFELQDYVDLHASVRLNPCNPPLSSAWLPRTAKAIAKSWRGNSLPETWKSWYTQHIQPYKWGPKRHNQKDSTGKLIGWRYQNWQGFDELRSVIAPFPPGKIGRVLRKELVESGYSDNLTALRFQESYDAIASSKPASPYRPDLDLGELFSWFESKWLEHYVANCLRASGLFDAVHIGVEPILDEALSDPVRFELDVVGIRGYQLFALSCSTSAKKMKQKLFEVALRARQLGGDEAKIGLVCTHDNPTHIESEYRATMNTQLRVFGSGHLHTLQQDLTAWVEGRDR